MLQEFRNCVSVSGILRQADVDELLGLLRYVTSSGKSNFIFDLSHKILTILMKSV